MRIDDILGLGTEEETERNGLLSSRKEWHSLSVGSFVGLVAGLNGGKDGAWIMVLLAGVALGAQKIDVGHLADVRREPAYALSAAVIGFLVTVFIIIPNLPAAVI